MVQRLVESAKADAASGGPNDYAVAERLAETLDAALVDRGAAQRCAADDSRAHFATSASAWSTRTASHPQSNRSPEQPSW
jgi:hypothetical protein